MKTKFIKVLVLKNIQRGGGAVLSVVFLLLFAINPGLAQLKQKRITALLLGDAAEGSRVTVVSDSALSDYEAFRRGDRFYVKLPLAQFHSAPPRCCGNGFEDVKVERAGDSLIVSFRLQAGATARVDQRSNRLDVIFSSPTKTFRSNPNFALNRQPADALIPRNFPNRGTDAAGPMPPGSDPAFRPRVITERVRPANESRAPLNPVTEPNRSTGSNKGENNQSSTRKSGRELASAFPSTSPIVTPSVSGSYPTLTTATPAAVGSPSAVGSSTTPAPPRLTWRARGKSALEWVSRNRLATFVGALILLSLLAYLATGLYRRRKATAARSGKAPKVQPKESPGTNFDELITAGPAISPSPGTLSSEPVKKPTIAAAAGASSSQTQWVLTKPSITTTSAGHEHSKDEEEREVFEL